MIITVADAFTPDPVCRNDQLDGAVRPGATGGTMDGIDAIKGSKIRDSGLQVGAGAFVANQQADSNC